MFQLLLILKLKNHPCFWLSLRRNKNNMFFQTLKYTCLYTRVDFRAVLAVVLRTWKQQCLLVFPTRPEQKCYKTFICFCSAALQYTRSYHTWQDLVSFTSLHEYSDAHLKQWKPSIKVTQLYLAFPPTSHYCQCNIYMVQSTNVVS